MKAFLLKGRSEMLLDERIRAIEQRLSALERQSAPASEVVAPIDTELIISVP